MGDGDLVAVWVLLENSVIRLDGRGVSTVLEFDLGLVVEGVARERVVGIILDDVAELRGCEGIFGGHVVAECGLVELIGGRDGGAGGFGCLWYAGRGFTFFRGRRHGCWRRCCGRGNGWECGGASRLRHAGTHGLLLTLDILH